jgi:DHA2 family multidrug resistance protein
MARPAAAAAAAPKAPSRGAPDDITLQGLPMILAVITLAFANFMVVLDMTIANVSVPNIAGGLAVSPSEGTWVITSYAVAEAITVPLTGWLASRFGAAKVFVACIGLFGLCSLLCGLSPSLNALVVFRILQGLSGGPMMPMSQTLLQRLVPPRLRAQTMGLWAMTTLVAPIMGPVLGGTISDTFGWSWVFFINVPVAVMLVALALRTLPLHESTQRLPVDFIGLGMLITWVGSLQIMLDKGEELDWFNSPIIVGLLIVAIVGFIAFLIWELTEEHPIVDLRIFRHHGFAMSCVAMSLTFAGMFSANVLIPLWLQTNQNYTASWAGIVTGFNGVLAIVAAPICAMLVTKVDPRRLVSMGVLWMAFIMFWRSTMVQGLSFHQLVWPQLALGPAMPFFFIPLMTLAMATLTPSELAGGAGLLNFVRTTAGAFATSLTTTAWTNSATVARTAFVGRLNDAPGVVDQLQASGLAHNQALGMLDSLVQSQAVMLSTNHVFMAISVLMVVSVGAIWLAPKPAPGAMSGGAGGH